eukprot:CAMPEP_0197317922 /NCGR_PEP_ID=MMETSP0891-20130614/49082_1 /TAXON_ID=44058 ORGANISM="Aureoumbra lagunensis, Strain CCMP1510" /NCGR_SAMPLE_ID=MMETSP0891 /ASSEMBLY_ACC=CAM_ASM_000534 /LENGTH=103 /DNA_ID=CAMNT_0042808129 /DNA_START=1 /DNA_END=308 /DNA_ORIENTATION=+
MEYVFILNSSQTNELSHSRTRTVLLEILDSDKHADFVLVRQLHFLTQPGNKKTSSINEDVSFFIHDISEKGEPQCPNYDHQSNSQHHSTNTPLNSSSRSIDFA